MQTAKFFDGAVDQCIDGGAVGHIQLHALAALGSQRVVDAGRAVVRRGGADHAIAALGEFGRDRGTDAARRAGHQRDLRGCCGGFAHASNSLVSASVAGS
ncbi:hypothetical protein SDC9_153917 [bioreactor metagenome]|uniref:Uncharacterized protein n=1 Tax=bioreactor metagenome TaxID=1076179 RepID=A0A645EXC2_9ZZZZ